MTPRLPDPRHVLITGASSGLGAALARAYAAPGLRLSLGGRDAGRLEAVAADCRAAGAEADAAAVDVTDREGLHAWIAEADAAQPLDLVIANAGISAGTGREGFESAAQTRRILATNVEGLVETVLPAIERMKARRRGQLALMASLAGYRGFPGAPAYCASKAFVKVWGEALRGHLRPEGIAVSTICPGYVATPMTEVNSFPMPFLMSPERAARIIRRGLARDRARIAFPWPTAFGAWLAGALPPAWTDPLLMRLPEKE
ncbi:Short-chain dehydrogenase [Tistlia consotensis]|uniref:Short-chain dehydrogenase n=1 Tax=Tistlia consotensis USBA 355 TaxID=560819 RepID=A0A1Y6CRC2_9PROT|nr:SDR family NAD(P)-dependent oxidoreductase [Tistlia consotensis]SMF83377.1 Short-chain dehydrogenase [Tistlia consotensis USBA 355]SNS32872.1 Short-chain dehydrogenase [Tistlia consotensis]